ncbi:hypothetical protein K7711_24110 [Nocardia sp. CA2R105]|uniref:hypothetical protein n=1 Tax=Nocardia coffeae TaxID=2873381 RepID=UPI001CA62D96|nr:hypothetical protein [Nocardia coffeae]MBY8859573.1 hypothetical protein [Nocardia coffeae]
MNGIDRIATNLESHLTITVLAALGAVVVVWGAIWAVRSARRRGLTGEQAGTLLAAAIATGVSAQGMWVFFDKSLHLTLSLRIMFFAFLEIMVLTSALRARSAQQVSGSAGIDGVAMWVLTCLSAVLAATDADNAGTVLIRLSAPLVAAWGWERSMALERRRSGALGGINWRITPERMLIRLGIADPTDRTADEAARQRRLIDVALAADHARTLRETGAGSRRINRARRHLQRVMRRAVEDGGLVDNARAPRTVLMDNLRILSGTGALVDLDLPSPWILDEESDTSTSGMFAAPALVASGAAADSHAVVSDEMSPVPSSATQNSSRSAGAQAIPGEWIASSDQATSMSAAQQESRPQPEPRMPAPEAPNSAAGQSTSPAEQMSSVEQAQRTAPMSTAEQLPSASTEGRPLPATAQTPANGRPLSPTTQTQEAGPSAQTQQAEAGQPLPATAQIPEAGQPTPRAAQTPDPGQALPPTTQTPADDPDLSAVTQTLPAVQPRSNTAWTWQAGQALPPMAPNPSGQTPADAARTAPAQSPEQEYAEPAGPYTATATPTASPQTAQSESAQANRQYRRDPAFRERVRELHADNAPTSEIAAQLGTSSRTIRRIIADLGAESDTSGRPNRNPAQAAVSSWHNGFRVLPGGNTTTAPGSGGAKSTADEQPPHRTDRSMEQ